MLTSPKLFVAYDFSNPSKAKEFSKKINPEQCGIKVGKELFTSGGPAIVEWLQSKGFKVFLDLKFHDIPTTVKRACYVASELGVWMLNVHAMGGNDMLSAAKEGVDQSNQNPYLIGVTVLTSMNNDNLNEIGINHSMNKQILKLALNVSTHKLDGIVCGASDIKGIKPSLPKDFIYVTPGIRLLSNANNDQKRIISPEDAIKAGSSILVVGRPITESKNPALTAEEIIKKIS
ncbi:MAG: orotidine-5'-phosphate decarboxylase [Methylophilaceae bacterium]|nr:orotidine-5'-phosphate decarboxylase [Methylophilaceae bacterium]